MRLFLALQLSEGLRDGLMAVCDGLDFGREVPEENLHLTLAFLDEQSESTAQALHERLADLRMPPVRLALQELDLLGGKNPSALVMLAERVSELMALHDKVAQAARLAGADLPRRRFKPHVTLLRLPRGLGAEAKARLHGFMQLRPTPLLDEAESFGLYMSELTADGPRYTELSRYPLAG